MSEPTVLILTNKEDVTSDYVILELQKQKIPYYRLNTEDYPQKLAFDFDLYKKSFLINHNGKMINLKNLKSIYYRRPKFRFKAGDKDLEEFYNRELNHALIGSLLSLNILWLNNPLSNRNAEFKIQQLSLAKKIGFRVPRTIISMNKKNITDFYNTHKMIIAKSLKKGFIDGKNGGVIYTSKIEKDDIDDDRIESFPTLFQEGLSKECDIRVTIVGDNIFSTKINSQEVENSIVDWRREQENIPKHTKTVIPKRIENLCFEITKKYKLVFSAIDLVKTKNDEFYFLELNPNGQWAWIEEQTGYQITEKLVEVLKNG